MQVPAPAAPLSARAAAGRPGAALRHSRESRPPRSQSGEQGRRARAPGAGRERALLRAHRRGRSTARRGALVYPAQLLLHHAQPLAQPHVLFPQRGRLRRARAAPTWADGRLCARASLPWRRPWAAAPQESARPPRGDAGARRGAPQSNVRPTSQGQGGGRCRPGRCGRGRGAPRLGARAVQLVARRARADALAHLLQQRAQARVPAALGVLCAAQAAGLSGLSKRGSPRALRMHATLPRSACGRGQAS